MGCEINSQKINAHEYAYGKWIERVSNTIHNSLKNDIFQKSLDNYKQVKINMIKTLSQ